jgi:ribosomal protein S3AE
LLVKDKDGLSGRENRIFVTAVKVQMPKQTSLVATMVRHVERKAISLQIHELAHRNVLHSLHLFSVVTLQGMALVGPLCGEWGIPSVCT